MSLTTEQQQAIKAVIDADQVLSALPNTLDSAFEIAAALNQEASPAFVIWRTRVSHREIHENGFDWTRLDNLNVGKARVWDAIFAGEGRTLNPSKINVRAGIEAVWVGTAQDLAVRAAVYVHCKKNATRAQQALSTGTGSEASPALLPAGFDEDWQITYQDAYDARNAS